MIDSGIVVASGISTIMAFISAFILIRHYYHYRKETPTNFWALAMFFYAIGHFIVTLLYAEILDNSVLTMFVYVNSSGAVTMSLFLLGTLSLFTNRKSIIISFSSIYGLFYFVGSFLYGFILPANSILNFINISGNFSALNNMSWFVVETLIPASIFLSILFLKDYITSRDHSSFWVSLHFFLYFVLLLIWPFPELKLLFYLGRTLATSCLLTGFTSLTQQRRLEGIIHEVETAESDFFLDLLSHDIKNRLQGVKMITDYYHIDNAIIQSSEFIERIETNLNSIFELIFKIEKYRIVQKEGGFTYLSTKQLTPIIKETIGKVTNNFPNKDIKVDLVIDKSISYWINANEFIEDVFVNLFSNAIKHNSKELVVIELAISSNLIRGVDYWVVSISDNGPGISEEKRKYLFTGKLRKDGSGIGLSIVKNIIDGYQGKITVRNKEDDNGEISGAVFSIFFPKAPIILEPVVT